MVPSYFYDGIVARWYFKKKNILLGFGFYLGIELYYFIVQIYYFNVLYGKIKVGMLGVQ